jgi:hypothetical protein
MGLWECAHPFIARNLPLQEERQREIAKSALTNCQEIERVKARTNVSPRFYVPPVDCYKLPAVRAGDLRP